MTEAAAPGRRLQVGPTDRTSAARTPMQPLIPIPPAARRSFTPFIERLPGVRAGENDLTRIAPGRPRAEGDVLALSGRVMDQYGRPLRRTLIEIWNANKWGRYTHVDDPAREPLDPNFLGFGRCVTDDEGRYDFLTIRPAHYLARPDIGRWRPAHVHFSVRGGGARLITQMYFAGDEHLPRDPCFALLGDAAGRHVVDARPSSAPGADLEARFDIVVGGRSASWFE